MTAPVRRRVGALRIVVAVFVLVLVPAGARAQVEGSARVTVFNENSTSNAGIRVIHPQGDVAGAVSKAFKLSAGYAVDMVSGATPAVFGPRAGVDAVSGATKFSDTRQEAHGGFELTTSAVTVAAGTSYGWENDYKSNAVSASVKGDLVDRNFTLALAWSHGFDRVCDANNKEAQGPLDLRALTSSAHCFDATATDVTTRRVGIDTAEPTLTWIATPRVVLQGGATLQIVDGFQSNPYRAVLVGSQHRTPQEHLPSQRERGALFVRGAWALPAARASITASVRGYRDTWDVRALTGELEIKKWLGPGFLLQARARAHRQEGAVFYRTSEGYRTLGPAGQYWTGDRELSPMSSYLWGGKVAWIRVPQRSRVVVQEAEVALKLDYLLYRLDSADAPNADRNFALVGQAAVALRF